MFNKIPPNIAWLSAKIFLFLALAIILPTLTWAQVANTTFQGSQDTGYKPSTNIGAAGEVSYNNTCYLVTNNSGVARFIPTKYANGWNAFVAVANSKNMTIGSCAACTAGVCCDIPTGTFKAAGTVCRASAGVCDAAEKCTGSAADCPVTDAKCPVNQYWNGSNCVAGPCRAASGVCDATDYCTGSSNACTADGYIASGTNTVCDTCAADAASGACSINDTGYRCDGTGKTCGTGNPYTCPANAPANGQVWNGSAWQATSATVYCGTSAYSSCSSQTPYAYRQGCTTAGACTVNSTYTVSGTACGGTEDSMCDGGVCVNKCSNLNGGSYTGNDDGDAYVSDAVDPNCGAECSSGVCCNVATGKFYSSSTVCRASAGVCDATEYCTGSSATCPATDAKCPANQYWNGSACVAGACRASAGVCDAADYCTGSANTCGDAKCAAGQYWNGSSCASGPCSAWSNPANGACSRTATNCSGTTNTCSGSTVYQYGANNQVWWSSAWATPSTSQYCGTKTYSCSGNNIIETYYGCTTAGACTVANTRTHATCTGGENSRCVAGQSTCQNLCSNGSDDDGDGYNDSQDSNCPGGYSQCTSSTVGGCCNPTNGSFCPANSTWNGSSCQLGLPCGTTPSSICDAADMCTGTSATCTDAKQPSTYICSYGACTGGAYNCAPTQSIQKCTGTGNTCTGATGSQTCNNPTNNYVWNGSAWAAASSSNYCNQSSTCTGTGNNTPTRTYYGCSTSGTCNATAAGTYNYTACTGKENSRCVAGNIACQNLCAVGGDEDGDGYTNGQDTDCGGCGQCTTGTCCNTATGCYLAVGTSCGTNSYCNGAGGCIPCTAGNYWDGFACVVCPAGHYCTGGTNKTPCPGGRYRSTTGGTALTSCSYCAAGYYGDPEYGTGLTVSTCSGCCESGFYCPAGSTSPTQNRCPTNTQSAPYATSSSSCTTCPAGTFWVDHQLLRVGEIIDRPACYTGYNLCYTCPAGSYCTGGIRYSCPPGTYGTATGATSSGACTPCPAGYACPGSETYYDYTYQY